MSKFTCLSLTPINLEHPGVVVATVRAGGVGILDREFCPDKDLEIATKNLDQLLKLVGNQSTVGLRLTAGQISSSFGLLNALAKQPHYLILCQWETNNLFASLEVLPKATKQSLLLEITDLERLSVLEANTIFQEKIDGFVARGQESGGWVGEEPAFIFTQKLLQNTNLPVYVQGGIGIHTARACSAMGTAGVVLDDQLWLMPESPLSTELKSSLVNLTGHEAITIGERLGKTIRVLSRPNFPGIKKLQTLAEAKEIESNFSNNWQWEINQFIGWNSSDNQALPIGQAIGLAEKFRDNYRTTGRLIQAVIRSGEETSQQNLFVPHSPLAKSHGTEYPIVQGPMTRVSDRAEFADAVSQGGALPMLALALMKPSQVENLLQEAKQLLGDRPWGVGILGFVPPELRAAQLEVITRIKPPFALIAGGRADQALELESQGIATYIHVPTPNLLTMFLEQGATKFIFEGRECGGHVGPLSSFVLWESTITNLLSQVPPQEAEKIHILFAGGIHDAQSAKMVSAMAAPLAARGMKVGVLMGSAYLFTEEAVQCGAIVEGFQAQALQCERTINLETGVGHASRCAVTPFAEEFYATRREMLAQGKSKQEIKEALEDLTLGRLRVASKGLVRNGNQIDTVSATQQLRDGMYMIGQIATMHNRVYTIAQLHQEVSYEEAEGRGQEAEGSNSHPSDIAIVGMGTLLPKAQYPDTFWENILKKVNAITEIPPHRWDWRLYYDPNPQARDKVVSKWGGFLEDVPFDTLGFGIPPKSLKSIEPVQLLTLETVRRALADAGYENADFDRENTAVILGASGGMSDLGQQYATRAELPRMVANPDSQAWERLPEWTEESFPGLLMNVTAGRVANRFDLGGANFTVDAACASSLAALDLAVTQLETGKCNIAIAGGFDAVQSAFAYFCFSKTQALSPQGVPRTFDKNADGIVISEGIAAVVLKRLADAERDGDQIYAVIKSVASSSDGKGLSMTAPATSGQHLALRRAYHKAGVNPRTIGMYEAHGTGTATGDRTELATISKLLRENSAEAKSCVLGSVKTMIGHTKSTAGIAALVKASLALHHQVLPPHTNVETPLEEIQDESSAVYLLTEAKPWLSHPNYPRRAGVSAFGFGGTNFHSVLEEYQGSIKPRVLGAKAWNYELFLFAASNTEELIENLTKLNHSLAQGAKPRLRDLAYSCAKKVETKENNNSARIGIVAESLSQLQQYLELALKHLQGKTETPLPPQIQLGTPTTGKIAFLFPGQGSQYPNMAREIALYFQEMRDALELSDRDLKECFSQPLSQIIQPLGLYTEAEEKLAKQNLTQTQIAQPAIGTVETGYLDLITRLGIIPDAVCGHSYGEYTALHAVGVLSRQEFLRLSEIRGRVMATACQGEDGGMAAVQATRKEILTYLAGVEDVVLANHNAPLQSVISGNKSAVAQVVEALEKDQINAKILRVAGAFHSHLISSAQEALAAEIATTELNQPQIPVYSNTTGVPYEDEIDSIRTNLSNHLLSSVEFVSQIEAMYAKGINTFIEVGPKSILTKLVSQILAEKDHTAVALDGNGGGMNGFLIALGTLFTKGIKFNPTALFSRRDVKSLSLPLKVETTLPKTTWLVNGGSARPITESVGHTGKIPALTLESKQQSRKKKERGHHTNHSVDYDSLRVPTQTKQISSQGDSQIKTNPPPASSNMNSHNNQPSEDALEAYQAYQQTMRQFLHLQEEVMKQFLNGTSPQIPQQPNSNFELNSFLSSTPLDDANNEGDFYEYEEELQQDFEELNLEIISPATSNDREITRESLAQTLVELVSDRTGYPQEMLGFELDLEADLGIDSIKRVEIFGALGNTLPPPLAESLKADMDSFTQVKTLNGLLDKLLENSQFVAAAINTQQMSITRESLAQTLVELVSDRTGYPQEMLGFELDLEADLGIDSIKRVEIFGALGNTLPPPLAESLKADMDSFTQVKTLNGLLDKLLNDRENSLGKLDDVVAIQRYEMVGKVKPIETLSNQATTSLSGLYLITQTEGINQSLATDVAEALQEKGATTEIITIASLRQLERLTQEVNEIREKFGQVRGIIHLAGQSLVNMPDNLESWQNLAQIQAKSLFHLLQICGEDLRQCQGRIIATSSLGGQFGRQGNMLSNPVAGGSNGLLKTMALEWEGVTGKALDFDAASADKIAVIITQELLSSDTSQEIGYYQGNRIVFEPQLRELEIGNSSPPTNPLLPTQDWVILGIGGARGITAEVIGELLVPGMTLILVGRSPEPQEESSLTKGIEDISTLRQILVKQAWEEGKQPTPVEIEKQITKIQRDRNLRINLEQFRKRGAQVEYHSLDVRNPQEFGHLIDGIYERFGRLDAFVQGAGIIRDKLIVDKTVDAFNQVFDTKVDSTFILSRYIRPETLKLGLIFASVAGRTGNPGQCDYAAANEVLNRFAWWMQQQWHDARIVAINWGPWDVTGMASESVNRQFRERGVIPISPSAGCAFVTQELLYGNKQDVELIAGIFQDVSQAGGEKQGDNSFPLLTSAPEISPDGTAILKKTITIDSDPFLIDHCLDGKPVLPAAVALEYMAQLVQTTWSDLIVAEVQDLRVWRGIVLDSELGKQVVLKAKAVDKKTDSQTLSVTAEILDPQKQTPFYRATLILRPKLESSPQVNLSPLDTNSGLDVASSYKKYCFHGKLFQLLHSINKFNFQGMTAQVKSSNPSLWLNNNYKSDQNWLFDPGLIDASLQMALMWTHIQGDTGALPSRFGKIVRYESLSPRDSLRIELRVQEFSDTTMRFNAVFFNKKNQICLQLIDMENTCSKALNRLSNK